MQKHRLEEIEQHIFSVFEKRDTSRLLTKEIFESTNLYANADLVRAFEDLEKRWRLLVRYTKDGSDWISLTSDGAEYAGVSKREGSFEPLPHPPNSVAPELGR
jgi:hypothetical protein